MTSTDLRAFDLVQQPWVPCRGPDGAVAELGLLDALGRSHELAGISGDLPTQAFALTRLLLAVLHSALAGPRDLAEWRQLWDAEKLPVERVAPYLQQHRARFDLLHAETPFLQVAGLRTAKGDTSELTKLVADVPNGVPFFTTRQTNGLSLSYAEAARWLVHCQAFDISGIKSGAVGDQRVKGGRGYPIGVGWSGLLGGVLLEGRTLKETLLLNLIARDFGDYARDPAVDRPVWERDPVTAAEEVDGGRAPTGPVDLYVWQSRRIRLVADDGRVTRVLIANGEKLTPQNKVRDEPHTAWRRSEAQEKKPGASGMVYMPREHDPDRAIWRGLQSMLPGTSSRQRGDGAKFIAPGVLEWLGYLGTERVLARDHAVRIRAIGMVYGSQNSVVDDVVYDSLAVRAILAQRGAENLAAIVTSCVEVAEAAVLAVGGLAADLVAAAGGDGSGSLSRARERLFAQLDSPFRAWLLTVGTGLDELDLQTAWHEQVSVLARMAARELLRDVPPACWEGRIVRGNLLTAAHADARFWKSLRTALPFAFPKVSDQPDAVA